MLSHLLALIVAAASPAAEKIELSVNATEGQSIAGEFTFRATVTSDHPVTQVEFYVGDDLRATDTSTPYEFVLDTLAIGDGPIKVSFAAYTSEGESAKKTLTLNVDNGVSKGLEYHLNEARTALQRSNWDQAIRSARVALKIDPASAAAKLAMARAQYGKGVLDLAQKFAEDASFADPKNREALELLAAINLRRAFSQAARGTDRDETLNMIREALSSAVESRRRSLDLAFDAFGPVTDQNLLQYADLCISSGRFSLAIEKLSPIASKNPGNNAVMNRLLYALLRAARVSDAMRFMDAQIKYGTPDAFAYALHAIIYAQFDEGDKAADAAKEAIQSDGEDPAVRTMQCYMALRQRNVATLLKLATELANDYGQLSETNYYLSTVYAMSAEFELARERFERCVLADPCNYDMYVERANEAISMALNFKPDMENRQKELEYQWKVARAYYETALKARRESFEALTGIAILNLLEKKYDEAVRMARAATVAGPGYAAAHYALSAALGIKESTTEARRAVATAAKLDAPQLAGRGIPDPAEAFQYFYRWARTPLLVYRR
jgi:tetratricopeptide (TPR) repeat protein